MRLEAEQMESVLGVCWTLLWETWAGSYVFRNTLPGWFWVWVRQKWRYTSCAGQKWSCHALDIIVGWKQWEWDAEVPVDSSLSLIFLTVYPVLPPYCQPCWPSQAHHQMVHANSEVVATGKLTSAPASQPISLQQLDVPSRLGSGLLSDCPLILKQSFLDLYDGHFPNCVNPYPYNKSFFHNTVALLPWLNLTGTRNPSSRPQWGHRTYRCLPVETLHTHTQLSMCLPQLEPLSLGR